MYPAPSQPYLTAWTQNSARPRAVRNTHAVQKTRAGLAPCRLVKCGVARNGGSVATPNCSAATRMATAGAIHAPLLLSTPKGGVDMGDLQSAVEDWFAGLAPDEFRAMVARTRPPDEPLPPEPPATSPRTHQ